MINEFAGLLLDSPIGIIHYIILSTLLFIIGISGILINRNNIINIMLSIELMLLSISINLVASSVFLNNITGQIFVIFILTVAAAEAAIGLAILIVYFRNRSNIDVAKLNKLRG